MNKYKIILVGHYSVGKTSIMNRYIYDTFTYNTYTTIGGSYYSKKIILDDKEVLIEFWDTCSMERYASIMPMFYKSSTVALIVYDVTSVDMFNKCISSIAELRKHVENVEIVIVGNKIDLVNDKVVTTEDGTMFAKNYNAYFKECSALNGEGIQELFQFVINLITCKKLHPIQQITLDSSKDSMKESSSCC